MGDLFSDMGHKTGSRVLYDGSKSKKEYMPGDSGCKAWGEKTHIPYEVFRKHQRKKLQIKIADIINNTVGLKMKDLSPESQKHLMKRANRILKLIEKEYKK